MRPTFLYGVRIAALLAPLAVAAAVAESDLLPGLAAQGWEEITFDGKQPNRYSICGAGCVKVETDASVSMIGRPVSVDLSRLPVLTWEWKLGSPVAASDLTTKGRDDRAVAVYVTFPYDPDTASFSEKLLRPFIEISRGTDAPARMLSYVWSGYGEIGDVVESPYFGGVNAMIVSRNATAPVGEWVGERFDVAADHRRAFGGAPATVAHVLIGADSDDTKTSNFAFVRNIVFAAK